VDGARFIPPGVLAPSPARVRAGPWRPRAASRRRGPTRGGRQEHPRSTPIRKGTISLPVSMTTPRRIAPRCRNSVRVPNRYINGRSSSWTLLPHEGEDRHTGGVVETDPEAGPPLARAVSAPRRSRGSNRSLTFPVPPCVSAALVGGIAPTGGRGGRSTCSSASSSPARWPPVSPRWGVKSYVSELFTGVLLLAVIGLDARLSRGWPAGVDWLSSGARSRVWPKIQRPPAQPSSTEAPRRRTCRNPHDEPRTSNSEGEAT
jgi:hypothetical protein